MIQKFVNSNYNRKLEKCNFNDAQIDLIIEQVNNFHSSKFDPFFDEDTYERDLWYTMNQSGLFEKDEENKTMITLWGVPHTRQYITEIPRCYFA